MCIFLSCKASVFSYGHSCFIFVKRHFMSSHFFLSVFFLFTWRSLLKNCIHDTNNSLYLYGLWSSAEFLCLVSSGKLSISIFLNVSSSICYSFFWFSEYLNLTVFSVACPLFQIFYLLDFYPSFWVISSDWSSILQFSFHSPSLSLVLVLL